MDIFCTSPRLRNADGAAATNKARASRTITTAPFEETMSYNRLLEHISGLVKSNDEISADIPCKSEILSVRACSKDNDQVRLAGFVAAALYVESTF